MTLLITGATGLIGQELIKILLEKPEYQSQPSRLRLLIRKRTGSPLREKFVQMVTDKGLDVCWGDLGNIEEVLQFTTVSDPEDSVLIHCGAVFNFYQPYDLLYDINVNGTRRILEGFDTNHLKKIVYVSSAAVYGSLNSSSGSGVTEESPIALNQRKSYEQTKSISEDLIWQYSKMNPDRLVTVVRPSGVIGGQGTTSDIFARMFFGRYVPLPNGGMEKLSLVDVKDVTRALMFFSDFEVGNGEAFNLVSFTPTLREFVLELAHVLHRPNIKVLSLPLYFLRPLYYLSRFIRFFKIPKENSLLLPILFDKLGQDIWIDNSKSQKSGFIPVISLPESMYYFQKFLSDNPWYAEQKFKVAL
jgi:nucleoside-diphosphate-sugar epimerase